jgi:hypothetical protein
VDRERAAWVALALTPGSVFGGGSFWIEKME